MTTTGSFESTPERVEAESAVATKAGALAHRFCCEGVNSGKAAVSALFLARAAQALESTVILSRRGAIADAMSVARTVVELDIEHGYLLAAEFEQRWENYVAFEATSIDKIMQAVGVLHDGKVDPAALAKLKQDATDAKQIVGSSRNWAGKTASGAEIDLRQRALATGRAHHYDIIYRDMCGASHGGFSTLRYVLPEPSASLPIKIVIGFNPPSAKPIALALASFFMLMRTAFDAAGQPTFRDAQAQLEAELRAVYEEPAT